MQCSCSFHCNGEHVVQKRMSCSVSFCCHHNSIDVLSNVLCEVLFVMFWRANKSWVDTMIQENKGSKILLEEQGIHYLLLFSSSCLRVSHGILTALKSGALLLSPLFILVVLLLKSLKAFLYSCLSGSSLEKRRSASHIITDLEVLGGDWRRVSRHRLSHTDCHLPFSVFTSTC